eukprot:scaffold5918_cov124-Isochrysis_galbana.AAC.4
MACRACHKDTRGKGRKLSGSVRAVPRRQWRDRAGQWPPGGTGPHGGDHRGSRRGDSPAPARACIMSVATMETPMSVKPRMSLGTHSRGKTQQSCPGWDRPVPRRAMADSTSKVASTCSNSSRMDETGTSGITCMEEGEKGASH